MANQDLTYANHISLKKRRKTYSNQRLQRSVWQIFFFAVKPTDGTIIIIIYIKKTKDKSIQNSL